MPTEYGIQHRDGTWWLCRNTWVSRTTAATAFDSWTAAELAGLREIRESSAHWTVRILPDPVTHQQSPVEA